MNVVIIFLLPIIFNNFHLIYANTAYWGQSYSYTHNSYKEAQAEGQRIVNASLVYEKNFVSNNGSQNKNS